MQQGDLQGVGGCWGHPLEGYFLRPVSCGLGGFKIVHVLKTENLTVCPINAHSSLSVIAHKIL